MLNQDEKAAVYDALKTCAYDRDACTVTLAFDTDAEVMEFVESHASRNRVKKVSDDDTSTPKVNLQEVRYEFDRHVSEPGNETPGVNEIMDLALEWLMSWDVVGEGINRNNQAARIDAMLRLKNAIVTALQQPGIHPEIKQARQPGWYWIMKRGWNDEYGPWTPALWKPEAGAWYSTEFSGIPNSELIVGGKLDAPVAI